MMAIRDPPWAGFLRVREHVEQKQELTVTDPGQTRCEAAGGAPVVLGPHRVPVALPVLAVGWIGDHVVETGSGVAVVRERAPEEDAFRVAFVFRLHEEVRLADSERFRIYLLPKQVYVRVRVQGTASPLALASLSGGDVLLGNGEHAARAAARVIDAQHHTLRAQPLLVAGQQQVDHEMDDVAGREVLARVLVQRLVELPDELLEDCAHGEVVDDVRVEVHLGVAEALHDQEEQARLVELADGVVEVELLQHLAHVGAEPGDVVAQVLRDVGRVGEQPREVVTRGVVEGESGGAPKQRIEVLEFAPVFGLYLQYLWFCRGQHAVEPAEHGERQDHILVLAALEGVTDQVRHASDEAGDLAVVHAESVECSRLPDLDMER